METAGPGLSTSVSEAPGGAAPTSTDVHVTPADLTAMVGALLQLPPSPAGSPEGPGGDLTGAECLALLVEATDLSHAGLLREPYQGWVGTLASDDPALRDAVRRAEFSGLLRGLDLRDFDPDRPASRTQVSRIVGNLRAKLTPLDATRFGAAGDGRTNDREAIQAALDAASAEGAPLYFPPGIYKIEFTQSDDHLTYEGDVSLIGAGRDSTVLDVHPKTVGDFGYRLLATKAPDSRLSLAELTLAGPSGSRADHPDEQEETVAVWAAPSSPYGSDNRIYLDDVAITGRFFRGIFAAGGGGILQARDTEISAVLAAIESFESTGTFRNRQVIIDRAVLESGIPRELTSDGRDRGIIVYVHPHVALRVTDTVFKNNPRGAIKQYGESKEVLDKPPLFSSYTNVSFVNCTAYTIITPGEDVTTTISGYRADAGKIGIRNDTVITDATFVDSGITEPAGHDQPVKRVTISSSSFTLGLPAYQAISSRPGWVVSATRTDFFFVDGADERTTAYRGGQGSGEGHEEATFTNSAFVDRTSRETHPESAIVFEAGEDENSLTVTGSRFSGRFSPPILLKDAPGATVQLLDNLYFLRATR